MAQVEKRNSVSEHAKSIEAARERDHDTLTGIFRYLDYPGGTLRFHYKKYKYDPLERYELQDGRKYSLPRMLVRHINTGISYTEYKHLSQYSSGTTPVFSGKNTGAVSGGTAAPDDMYAVHKKRRCEFVPIEFMDDMNDFIPSPIIEVTTKN